ncbi:hypothetical protein RUND412_007655 [Rhizina undulata]
MLSSCLLAQRRVFLRTQLPVSYLQKSRPYTSKKSPQSDQQHSRDDDGYYISDQKKFRILRELNGAYRATIKLHPFKYDPSAVDEPEEPPIVPNGQSSAGPSDPRPGTPEHAINYKLQSLQLPPECLEGMDMDERDMLLRAYDGVRRQNVELLPAMNNRDIMLFLKLMEHTSWVFQVAARKFVEEKNRNSETASK